LAQEILFSTLATIHNLTHYLEIVRRMRESILGGRFPQFLASFRSQYHSAAVDSPENL
jgi:queuine tRNA-ribosyltransferase